MMSRKIVAIFALVSLLATAAFAVEGGNPKKRKFLYKKNCKWDRFFRKGHPGPEEAWKNLSEQELLDINQFLYDHAADSDQPQTCG